MLSSVQLLTRDATAARCGDKGRPNTEIALPAGYGFANSVFVSTLSKYASRMVEQCAATPAYNIDISLSFASWWRAVDLSPLFDWTDPRVNWAGGQKHLWRAKSRGYIIDHHFTWHTASGAPRRRAATVDNSLLTEIVQDAQTCHTSV